MFESGEVVQQLWYSAMMETIRIQREGSSNQEDHGSNNSTFVFQWKTPTQNGKGIENLVQVLSKRLSLSEAEWQIDHSKIFFKIRVG